MKVIELKPDDLPVVIRPKLWNETKDYVLLKTKQDRLLLNKSIETVARLGPQQE